MYYEFVKQLRDKAGAFIRSRPDIACDYRRAADAIEELYRENESLAKSVNEASELLRKRWIPVTERLPKMRDAGILKKLGINLRSDKCLIVISDGKDQIVDNNAELRDGKWYSDTLRWLSAGKKPFEVTHWMSMPEPPKEKNHDWEV